MSIQINIPTDFIAWYGAVVSTLSLGLGIYKIWIDRAKLKFIITQNWEIWGTDTNGTFKNLHPEKIFWDLKIANIGRRPITIESVGVEWRNKKGGAVIFKDYNGPLCYPFEIKPGNSKTILIDESLIKLKDVKNIYVRDSCGKEYRHKLKFP